MGRIESRCWYELLTLIDWHSVQGGWFWRQVAYARTCLRKLATSNSKLNVDGKAVYGVNVIPKLNFELQVSADVWRRWLPLVSTGTLVHTTDTSRYQNLETMFRNFLVKYIPVHTSTYWDRKLEMSSLSMYFCIEVRTSMYQYIPFYTLLIVVCTDMLIHVPPCTLLGTYRVQNSMYAFVLACPGVQYSKKKTTDLQ